MIDPDISFQKVDRVVYCCNSIYIAMMSFSEPRVRASSREPKMTLKRREDDHDMPEFNWNRGAVSHLALAAASARAA